MWSVCISTDKALVSIPSTKEENKIIFLFLSKKYILCSLASRLSLTKSVSQVSSTTFFQLRTFAKTEPTQVIQEKKCNLMLGMVVQE